MKKYSLIAFDIDGTILDNDHQVCSKLIKVVALLKKQGYLFTLASARMPQSVIKIAHTLGIADSYQIALNGSLITDFKHNVLYSKCFSTQRVLDALNTIDKQISRNYYNSFDWIIEYPNSYTLKEMSILGDSIIPREDNLPDEVNKITLIGEPHLLAIAQAKLIKDESLLVSQSHTNYLEITCNTISKFSGLAYYASKLNLPIDEIIAFGDGENDMSMLSGVGLGVAMANAKDHVKASATDVAGYHYEEGVANYLSEILL